MDPARRRSQFIIVSCWETNEVVVLRHATTTERYTDPAQPDEPKIRMTESRLVSVMKTGPHPSCPRSLLLYNFGKGRVSHKKVKEEDTGREITVLDAPSDYLPYLLVGMADGTLASYALDADKTDGEIVPEITLADRKIVSLGTTPVSLTVMELEGGVPAVCACGSRASFFFHGQGRLQQSPVLVNVSFICASPVILLDDVSNRE
jgi:DNA damage-binding protein 1